MFFALFSLSSFNAFSHEYKMTSIVGTNIKLEAAGHGFAGSVNDKLIFGRKIEGQFVSRLEVLAKNHNQSVSFQMKDNVFQGDISSTTDNGDIVVHQLTFTDLDRNSNTYSLKFDEQEIEVQVTADKFENGHFINPRYETEVNGEKISFKILDGQACYGYSLHIIFMILGSYLS